jgi:hypothetical protein
MIDQMVILDLLVFQLQDQHQDELDEKVLVYLMLTVVDQKIKIQTLI